jgi:catechol 2,3-dioxygenase-like lactoylglutathione lyase family enzyme
VNGSQQFHDVPPDWFDPFDREELRFVPSTAISSFQLRWDIEKCCIITRMEPRISLITLGVSDLARSTSFYRDGLGLPTHGDFPGVTFFNLKGTWLSIYSRDELAADARVPAAGQGFGGFALAHNVRSKDEVNAILDQAKKAGAVITKPAQEADWGGYSGYFADPDGYLWEVAWNPHWQLKNDGSLRIPE